MNSNKNDNIKVTDLKFKMRRPAIQSNLGRAFPQTPLGKTNMVDDMPGSTIYISNRKCTEQIKQFSVLSKQFDVVTVLGQGCFGTTFEVIDKLRGFRRFALKRTKTHHKQNLMEASTMLGLNSPCIIAVYGCWQESGALFVQTELGTLSLKDLIDSYVRVPERLFWTIATDLSEALTECHRRKVLHLDIKPSNILVSDVSYFTSASFSPTEQRLRNRLRPEELDNITPDCQNFQLVVSGVGQIGKSAVDANPIAKKVGFAGVDDVLSPAPAVQSKFVDVSPLAEIKSEPAMNHLRLSPDERRPQSDGPKTAVKHISPLQRLGCSQMEELPERCIFQMIDFGLAQREVGGSFIGECVCGDAGYVCQTFMQTGRPDYSSDVYSLGLTLLEVLTGIELPINGPLFEKLRHGCWTCCLDPLIFGSNLQEFVDNDEVELAPCSVPITRDAWRAVNDLIRPNPGDRLTIAQWRIKYLKYLQDRSQIYNLVSRVREELFNITDSELENRCVVVSKEMRRNLERRKQKMVKKIAKHLTKSSIDQIRTAIPDINAFIIHGGKYISGRKRIRSQITKDTLRNTVTFMQSGMKLSIKSQPQPQQQKPVMFGSSQDLNKLSFENGSPMNCEGLVFKDFKDQDFEMDFLDDGKEKQFFQPPRPEMMRSIMHEDSAREDNNSFVHIESEKQNGKEFIKSLSPMMAEKGEEKQDISAVSQQSHDIFKVESRSEIPLQPSVLNNKSIDALDEVTERFPERVQLSEVKSEKSDTSLYYSSTGSSPVRIERPKQSKISSVFSLLETLTGIAPIVYFPAHYYQTPTMPTIIKDNLEKKDQSIPPPHTENDEMLRHQLRSSIKPQSGSFARLKKSELLANGFLTPNRDTMIDRLERKRQNHGKMQWLGHNRPLVFLAFILMFVLVVYPMKIMRMIGLEKMYNKTLKWGNLLLMVLSIALVWLLYQLNTHNVIESNDPEYLLIKGTGVYYDPVKLKRAIFGFILPNVFFVVHFLSFWAYDGDVGILFFALLIVEFTLLKVFWKQ